MQPLSDGPKLPRANSRFYEMNGQRYWRVTSILGAMNKPALVPWAAKMEREACIETARALFQNPPEGLSAANYGAAFELAIGKAKAHVKATQEAQDIGTQAHRRLEWVVRGRVGPEPQCFPAALHASKAGERWLEQVGFKLRFAEQTVFSDYHGYAGTMDIDGEATLPGLGRCMLLGDYKTGKAVYAEARLQAAAYRQAMIEMGHASRPYHAVILRLPKVETDPEFEAVVLHDSELQALFPTFVALRQVFMFAEEQDEAWRSKRRAA